MHGNRRAGFTLIELLVVIAIIAILASLLMPALEKARNSAMVVSCASTQRQMFLSLGFYANDSREYPTRYAYTAATSWNWGDECAGLSGGPPTPPGGVGWLDLLLNGNYAQTQITRCNGRCPAGWQWANAPWGGGTWMYNGPHTWGANIFNNGSLAWLSRMGRRSNPWDNDSTRNWGVRFKDSLIATDTGPWGPSRIAFVTCPSMYQTTQLLIREPHGSQAPASYNGIDYSNGQADGMWGTWNVLKFDRNYLYGDGHVVFIHDSTRVGYPK